MSGPEITPPVAAPVAPARRRGLRIALIVSLMANLLLVGILAGGVMRYARFDPPVPGQPDYRALWHALPDRAQDELRALSRERGFPGDHASRPSREERRARFEAANARIIALLRAEPFDAEAFGAVLNGDREALERRLNAARRAFAEQVAHLSPAERQAMAARLEADWGDRLPRR